MTSLKRHITLTTFCDVSLMVSFDDLAAGSDIHDACEASGKVILTPRPDCHDEFHTLVGHLYEVLDRGFAIFIIQSERGLYESAEIMRLN